MKLTNRIKEYFVMFGFKTKYLFFLVRFGAGTYKKMISMAKKVSGGCKSDEKYLNINRGFKTEEISIWKLQQKISQVSRRVKKPQMSNG